VHLVFSRDDLGETTPRRESAASVIAADSS
jgi:hypothetical protein